MDPQPATTPLDARAFLVLLRDEPGRMDPVPGDALPAALGLLIEQRRLDDEPRDCLRCGREALCTYIAETKAGLRWLDLCAECDQLVRVANEAGAPA